MVIERGDSYSGDFVGAGVYLGVADATGSITKDSLGYAWGYYPHSGVVHGVNEAMAGNWQTSTYTDFNKAPPLNTSRTINGAKVDFTVDMQVRRFFISVNGGRQVDAGVTLPPAVRPWVQLGHKGDKVRLCS